MPKTRLTTAFRKTVHKALISLRKSRLRKPILKLLARVHNTSYHFISFFASHTGIHPKHDIINYRQFFRDNITQDDTILDIGSSNGELSYDVAKKAKKVVGIELLPERVAHAQKTYPDQQNLSFVVGDATTYPFTETFDAIVLSNTLEHIEDRVAFLKKLAQRAPKILIRVPMITRDWVSVYKKQEGFEYRLDDTHYIEYDHDTFASEMNDAELTIVASHVKFGELYAIVERSNNKY